MKRLISAVLALSMLGATAAAAQPYGHGSNGRHGNDGHSYSRSYGGSWNRHNDGGALIGLGIGLFALGAIAAASSHNRDYDRGYDRYEYAPPPPPPPAYYGYGRGYGY